MAKDINNALKNERELGMINMEIKNLKEGQDRIEGKLDLFIDCADKRYATKLELNALREANIRQDEDIKWTKDKIVDLLVKLTGLLAIVGFGAKASGLF